MAFELFIGGQETKNRTGFAGVVLECTPVFPPSRQSSESLPDLRRTYSRFSLQSDSNSIAQRPGAPCTDYAFTGSQESLVDSCLSRFEKTTWCDTTWQAEPLKPGVLEHFRKQAEQTAEMNRSSKSPSGRDLSEKEFEHLEDLGPQMATWARLVRLGSQMVGDTIDETFRQAKPPGAQRDTEKEYKDWFRQRESITRGFFGYKNAQGASLFNEGSNMRAWYEQAGLIDHDWAVLDDAAGTKLGIFAREQATPDKNWRPDLITQEAIAKMPWAIQHFLTPDDTGLFRDKLFSDFKNGHKDLVISFCLLGSSYFTLRTLARQVAAGTCYEACRDICSRSLIVPAVNFKLERVEGSIPTELAKVYLQRQMWPALQDGVLLALPVPAELKKLADKNRRSYVEKHQKDLTEKWVDFLNMSYLFSFWLGVERADYNGAHHAIQTYFTYLNNSPEKRTETLARAFKSLQKSRM